MNVEQYIFTDTENRKISILFDDPNISAHYDGIKIGEFIFEYEEVNLGYGNYTDYHPKLYHMTVNSDFQKAGIGTEMIRIAVAHHGYNFKRPNLNAIGGKNMECDEYYTLEGNALIRSCINKGIIPEEQEEYED